MTLLVLARWLTYEGIGRLLDPPHVTGMPVLITALVGVVVNGAATWMISRAGRSSLNVEVGSTTFFTGCSLSSLLRRIRAVCVCRSRRR